jgi:hypothetical protein
MAKASNIVKPKSPRGRPVDIGATAFVGLKVPPALLDRVKAWAKRHKIEGRSEALRALIERGLEGK